MTDNSLIEFARGFRKGVLGGRGPSGMCAAICYPLESLLAQQGIVVTVVHGEVGEDGDGHVWLELPDGRILDPTADQFDDLAPDGFMPDIYLGTKPDYYF